MNSTTLSYSSQTLIDLSEIRQLVQKELEQVDHQITHHLKTRVDLIEKVCSHIIKSGGKRLRPLLALLSAKLCGYSEGHEDIQIALIIEFIHTATLLHDDVVDASTLRRGNPTANAIWDNQTPVLVGDFLYSRTFQLLTQLKNFLVMDILAEATNTIAEGEILQLIHRHNTEITEDHYLEVIRCKTAVLFSAAAELGAVITKRPSHEQKYMANYGLHLGMAFQMIDDLLDYSISENDTGKNPGDDLSDGKITLPLIYALQHATPTQQQVLKEAMTDANPDALKTIIPIMQATGAFDYVRQCAKQETLLAKTALQNFKDNPYKQALLNLAELALERTK